MHDGKQVARHPRLRGSQQRSARLDHYLELLARKPGALEHSLALRQEREQGRWPECFDQLWKAIEAKVGASEAARQMVDVLMLCREHGLEVSSWRSAARWPPARTTGARCRCWQTARPAPSPRRSTELPERLAKHDRPAPSLFEYDQLLEREQAR